jgi:SPP1 family predicted phage head-tail adaptor
MRAGDRDKRVIIRAQTTADDGRGGQTVTWSDVSPRWWVSINALSAREFLQAGAMQNAGTQFIRGLYRGDVTIKHRLYWALRGVTFEIVSLNEASDQGVPVLDLECVEVDV